jgi:hypothetical protein
MGPRWADRACSAAEAIELAAFVDQLQPEPRKSPTACAIARSSATGMSRSVKTEIPVQGGRTCVEDRVLSEMPSY